MSAPSTSRRRRIPNPGSLAVDAWTRFSAWLTDGQHATFGFSLLRIIFGVSMLIVLIPSFPDRHYLWGVGSRWIEPEARRRGWFEPLRMLFPKESAFWFDAAYITLIVLALLFIVGWRTRWVTPVLLVFWVGLSTNSTLLNNGGDTLMRIVLLFSVFANLSEHFSVDAVLRRRRAARHGARERGADGMRNWMHNTALILCGYQILLVYLVSSILKLSGEEWLDGTALYYALMIDEFRVFPAVSDVIAESSVLVRAGSWMALVVQLVFPLALLWRRSRYVAVVLITGMHLGIAVLLGLWPFSLAMIALDLLLVRDASWQRAWGFVARSIREVESRTLGALGGGSRRQGARLTSTR